MMSVFPGDFSNEKRSSEVMANSPPGTSRGVGLPPTAMMKRAAETVVLADHTKFGRSSLSVYGPWSPQLLLVSDEEPSDELRTAITRAGARSLLA